MKSVFVVTVVVLLVLACSGCGVFSFTRQLFLGFDEPGSPTEEGGKATTPFPWDWVIGLALMGAVACAAVIFLLKMPTLVDEVLVATVAVITLVIGIRILELAWEAKWLLVGGFGVLAAVLAGWKLTRRFWLSSGTPPPPVTPPPRPSG